MIDYKLLEALAMVIEEGGFDKAAARLNITQSAVSQRVRLFEERNGQILLTRSTPPRVTAAGQQLLKHYHQVRLLEEGLDTIRSDEQGATTLAIGINADSLASWFLDAVTQLLADGDTLVDLHVDDQEQTHRLLRDGVVVGCISDEQTAIQGCRVDYLGSMIYRLLATPDFRHRWFANGLTLSGCQAAPAVIFNRKDNLHHRFITKALGNSPQHLPNHYIPMPEAFLQMITSGCAYGMVPDWQGTTYLGNGELVELHPATTFKVDLYWHCWNLSSPPLENFTRQMNQQAKILLSS